MSDFRGDAMLEAMDEARHEVDYRRVEVITGRRRRRNWTDDEKARILEESASPDANISAVARRWGVNRGLLNIWRREAGLTRRTIKGTTPEAMFVPIRVIDDHRREAVAPVRPSGPDDGRIDIEIDGARMIVSGSVSPQLAHALVSALRGRR